MTFGKNRLSSFKLDIENLNSQLNNVKIMLVNRVHSFQITRGKRIFRDGVHWNLPIDFLIDFTFEFNSQNFKLGNFSKGINLLEFYNHERRCIQNYELK